MQFRKKQKIKHNKIKGKAKKRKKWNAKVK